MKYLWLLLVLVSVAAGQVFLVPSKRIEDSRCDFCGAKVQYLAEDRIGSTFFHDNMEGNGGQEWWGNIPDSLMKQDYTFSRHYTLCPKCYAEYKGQLDSMYIKVFYDWFHKHEKKFRKQWAKNTEIIRKERIAQKEKLVKEDENWNPEYPVPPDAQDPDTITKNYLRLGSVYFITDSTRGIILEGGNIIGTHIWRTDSSKPALAR